MFKNWLNRRRMLEGLGDAGGFGINPSNDYGVDQEKVKKQLFDLIMSKYPEEMDQFLNGIAHRGDQEISNLLSKLGKKVRGFARPNHDKDIENIVPPKSDSGFGGYDGDGD